MVVSGPEDLDPEKLTERLRGVLPIGRVTAVQAGAARAQLVSTIVPLRVEYSADAPSEAPTRLILKATLPGLDASLRSVGEREVGFDLKIAAAWSPSDLDGSRHVAWVRQGWEDLRSHSVGVYANFLSDEDAAGVAAAYGQRLKRLTALKDRYDPTNVFRLNANIPPSR